MTKAIWLPSLGLLQACQLPICTTTSPGLSGQNLFTTRTHKSETLDYGILLSGERVLVTDDGERALKPGDVVVQIGSWHAWSNPNDGSQMAFVMMGAKFDE